MHSCTTVQLATDTYYSDLLQLFMKIYSVIKLLAFAAFLACCGLQWLAQAVNSNVWNYWCIRWQRSANTHVVLPASMHMVAWWVQRRHPTSAMLPQPKVKMWGGNVQYPLSESSTWKTLSDGYSRTASGRVIDAVLRMDFLYRL